VREREKKKLYEHVHVVGNQQELELVDDGVGPPKMTTPALPA
jgi:hypothetical protein